MKNAVLLVLEPGGASPTALDMLSAKMDLVLGPLSRSALIEKVGEATGLWIRLAHRIDAPVLERAERLRFIASATTGLNHIDLDAAARAGVAILSLKGERQFLEGVHATGEHCWALLLSLIRKLPAAHSSVLQDAWDRDRFRGRELHSKTLGIVGFGRVGAKVAGFGRAFGMDVLAVDPVARAPDWVTMTDLRSVVEQSDVLSIHVDHRPETVRLIDSDLLSSVKPGCLIVNTSRGEILDERALVEGLRSGRVGGAALDVLCRETGGEEAVEDAKELLDYAREHDNLIVTPHLGGATAESMDKTEVLIAQKILDFLKTR